MPITSLNNFGVPTDAGNQVLLMPKLKYRFRVTLLGFGVNAATELTKQVVDVSRPKVGFEEMPLDVYNSKVYLAGKYTFETLALNLRDDATGEVQKLVGQQVQKQFDFVEQASARSGIDYKFTTKIEVLDGGNGNNAAGVNVLETQNMYGCFLTNVDYGDANYATNEAMQVALTIRFDNMVQWGAGEQGVGVGIGATVERTLGNTTTGATTAAGA
jgi:hypothetical protein|tara:strand:- start:3982 stop:4626 length:645 start_codon:yes stop_codon:yes gene_type:complete